MRLARHRRHGSNGIRLNRMQEQPPPAEAIARLEADRKHLEFFRNLITDGNIILGTLGFGIRIERSIPTMAFDHRRREVLVNPDFLEREGHTDAEKRYSFGHEIAHFVQMVQDPEIYLATFEDARRRSETVEDESLREPINKAWNRFYNVFLDVHDNAIVDNRSMWTQAMPQEEHPRQKLYERFKSDLRGHPKVEQFNFAILKHVMAGADVRVDDDIVAVLGAPYSYAGQTYDNLPDFVKRHFFDADLPLHVWMSKLQRTLAPIYDKLLQQDIASRDILRDMDSVELTGEEGDESDAEKIIEGIKRSRETGTDRSRRASKERYYEKMKDGGFSDHEISEMERVRERTEVIYPTLVALWDAFVTREFVSDIVKQTGFRTGDSLDVDAFVRELPKIFTEPDMARIMERSINEPIREMARPKRIQLFCVLDLSGSMDAEKRRAVQEVAYALTRSLVQYQTEKKLHSDDVSSDAFQINLRCIGFGTDFQDIFDRTPLEEQQKTVSTENPQEIESRLARFVLNVGRMDLGGTNDAGPLQEVLQSISDTETRERLDASDDVVVVIEVTDGETATINESKHVIKELNGRRNVFARGIKIPGMIHSDQPTPRPETAPDSMATEATPIMNASGAFPEVWGEHGEQLDRLEQLKEVLIRILFAAVVEKQKS